ncbi:DNA polymerase IV [Acidiferrimicrobium sp. IK]|uniref:DNA polymerase IV n=1 Tax=Acidiferrimicrobium sp. IK TaxID=2871700 RepID=UPI0021CAEC71|nr:DNA polymerase IV [Acidiferrimicrobium sp. IK]MCU4183704.1 DNA polymerase IV [Acidiferrimicrobium sp. IK]
MARPTIIHVDMDAFYAAVEVLDDPSLAGRPLIVGGTGARGVVAACSYEARVYGIRSAMPTARARSLCPHATFLPGRFDRYREVSEGLHAILSDVTPLVEGIALDEAFLDVRGAEALFGPAPSIAADLRARITAELGLSSSVGVAPSKFLAKLASEAAKPVVSDGGTRPGAGVVVIEEGQELAFLQPLPIEALWGVGPATAARLRRLGLSTVGSLAAVPLATLEGAVGRSHGRHLHRLAHAIDDRPVEPDRTVKSVGHEETYATDRFDPAVLHTEVLRMSDAVAARLRDAGVAGRTVTVKVRYGDFRTITRSRTGPDDLDASRDVARAASALLDAVDVSPGVRLLGVSVSALRPVGAPSAEQLTLRLDAPAERPEAERSAGWAAAADAVDEVRRRFGARSVGSAALIGPGGLRVKRQGDTQWGPAAPGADGGPGSGGRRRERDALP